LFGLGPGVLAMVGLLAATMASMVITFLIHDI
jgi:hypothetical protein